MTCLVRHGGRLNPEEVNSRPSLSDVLTDALMLHRRLLQEKLAEMTGEMQEQSDFTQRMEEQLNEEHAAQLADKNAELAAACDRIAELEVRLGDVCRGLLCGAYLRVVLLYLL